MRIKVFTLMGIIGYLGFFVMGNFITEFIIPWLITSQTIAPESIPLLASIVSGINTILYTLLVVFYTGYFKLIEKEEKLFKTICILGVVINIANIINVIFLSGDYNLSQSLYIAIGIMGFAVNLGFLSRMIHLYTKDKFIVTMAIIGMLPFSISPLFTALMLCKVLRYQMNSQELNS